jgi:hypothetical protein
MKLKPIADVGKISQFIESLRADPDLSEVIEAWPAVPEAVKEVILDAARRHGRR